MVIRNIAVTRNIGLLKEEFAQNILNKYLVNSNYFTGFFPLVLKRSPLKLSADKPDIYRVINSLQLQLSLHYKQWQEAQVAIKASKPDEAGLSFNIFNNWFNTYLVNTAQSRELKINMDSIFSRIYNSMIIYQNAHEKLEDFYSNRFMGYRPLVGKAILDVLEKYTGIYKEAPAGQELIRNRELNSYLIYERCETILKEFLRRGMGSPGSIGKEHRQLEIFLRDKALKESISFEKLFQSSRQRFQAEEADSRIIPGMHYGNRPIGNAESVKEAFDRIWLHRLFEKIITRDVINTPVQPDIDPVEDAILNSLNREERFSISVQQLGTKQITDSIFNRIIGTAEPVQAIQTRLEEIHIRQIYNRQSITNGVFSKVLERYLSGLEVNIAEDRLLAAGTERAVTVTAEMGGIEAREYIRGVAGQRQDSGYESVLVKNRELNAGLIHDRGAAVLRELVRRGLAETEYITEPVNAIIQRKTQVNESIPEAFTFGLYNMRQRNDPAYRLKEILEQIKINELLGQVLTGEMTAGTVYSGGAEHTGKTRQDSKEVYENAAYRDILSIFNREERFSISMQQQPQTRQITDGIFNRIIGTAETVQEMHTRLEEIHTRQIYNRQSITNRALNEALERYLFGLTGNIIEDKLPATGAEGAMPVQIGVPGAGLRGYIRKTVGQKQDLGYEPGRVWDRELHTGTGHERNVSVLRELLRRGFANAENIENKETGDITEPINRIIQRKTLQGESILETFTFGLYDMRQRREPVYRLREILEQIKVNELLGQVLTGEMTAGTGYSGEAEHTGKTRQDSKEVYENAAYRDILSIFNREERFSISMQQLETKQVTDGIFNRIIGTAEPVQAIQTRLEEIHTRQIYNRQSITNRVFSEVLERYLTGLTGNIIEDRLLSTGTEGSVMTATGMGGVEAQEYMRRAAEQGQDLGYEPGRGWDRELYISMVNERSVSVLRELIRRGLVNAENIRPGVGTSIGQAAAELFEREIRIRRESIENTESRKSGEDVSLAESSSISGIYNREAFQGTRETGDITELISRSIQRKALTGKSIVENGDLGLHNIQQRREPVYRLREIIGQIRVNEIFGKILAGKDSAEANAEKAEKVILSIFNREERFSISMQQQLETRQITDGIFNRIIGTAETVQEMHTRLEEIHTRQIYNRQSITYRAFSEVLDRYLTGLTGNITEDRLLSTGSEDALPAAGMGGVGVSEYMRRAAGQRQGSGYEPEGVENRKLYVSFVHERSAAVLRELVRRGLAGAENIGPEIGSLMGQAAVERLTGEIRELRELREIREFRRLRESLASIETSQNRETSGYRAVGEDGRPAESEFLRGVYNRRVLNGNRGNIETEDITELANRNIQRKMLYEESVSERGIPGLYNMQQRREPVYRLREIIERIRINELFEQILTGKITAGTRYSGGAEHTGKIWHDNEEVYENAAYRDILNIFNREERFSISMQQQLETKQITDGIFNRIIGTAEPVQAIQTRLEEIHTRQIYNRQSITNRAFAEVLERYLTGLTGYTALINRIIQRKIQSEGSVSESGILGLYDMQQRREPVYRLREIIGQIRVNELLEEIFTGKDTDYTGAETAEKVLLNIFNRKERFSISMQQKLETRQITDRTFNRITGTTEPVQAIQTRLEEIHTPQVYNRRPITNKAFTEVLERLLGKSNREGRLGRGILKIQDINEQLFGSVLRSVGAIPEEARKYEGGFNRLYNSRQTFTNEHLTDANKNQGNRGRSQSSLNLSDIEPEGQGLIGRKPSDFYNSPVSMDMVKVQAVSQKNIAGSNENDRASDQAVNGAESVRMEMPQAEMTPSEVNRIVEKVICEVEKRSKFERQKKGLI